MNKNNWMRIANNRRNKSIKKNTTERVLSVDEVPFIFMKKSRKKITVGWSLFWARFSSSLDHWVELSLGSNQRVVKDRLYIYTLTA